MYLFLRKGFHKLKKQLWSSVYPTDIALQTGKYNIDSLGIKYIFFIE